MLSACHTCLIDHGLTPSYMATYAQPCVMCGNQYATIHYALDYDQMLLDNHVTMVYVPINGHMVFDSAYCPLTY